MIVSRTFDNKFRLNVRKTSLYEGSLRTYGTDDCSCMYDHVFFKLKVLKSL